MSGNPSYHIVFMTTDGDIITHSFMPHVPGAGMYFQYEERELLTNELKATTHYIVVRVSQIMRNYGSAFSTTVGLDDPIQVIVKQVTGT